MQENQGEVDRGRQTRFPALQSRNFRLLWIGQTISAAGSQMQFWAINWQIYAITHNPLALGLIGLFRVVPILIFSLVGGTVADISDRRRVMLVTQTSLAGVAAILSQLTRTHQVNAAWIYALTACGAAAVSFDNPARQSLIPNLVPREHYPNAAALNSMAMQIAKICGPMLAGILIAKNQLALAYALNAVSFLTVIAGLLMMRMPAIRNQQEEERGKVNLASLLEGLAFVRRTPILVWTMGLDFVATFFSSADSLLPVFARDILQVGPEGYGRLAAASAVGSLLAGGIMTLRRPVFRQGLTVIWAVVVFGAATVIFGATKWFWLAWLALAVIGAADTVSTILRQTIRQLVSPDHLRGRMTAVNMIFFMGGPQLGELEAGFVAKLFGAPFSVISGGIACLLATAWIAGHARTLREYTSASNLPT